MHPSMQRVFSVLKGVTSTELANAINESPQNVTNWTKRGVSKAGAMKICSRFNIDLGFILNGENLPAIHTLTSHDNIELVKTRLLPVLSWVQAGNFTSVDAVHAQDIQEWWPAINEYDCKDCFYLRVRGISNFPTYQEGDLIQVDPCVYVSSLVSGDVIVVRDNDETTFKKLVIEPSGRKYLQAMNPDWKPNIIEFTENTHFIGLVVDGVRPLVIHSSKKRRQF